MRWSRHPWKRTLHPEKSPPRKVVLPEDGSQVQTNGHSPILETSQDGSGRPPERILCFPASIIRSGDEIDSRAISGPLAGFSPGSFQGIRADVFETASRIFPHGVRLDDFRPRPDVEQDEFYKQVVACVVPWHPATRQVWTFVRGESEGRLGGKLSCLPGGHANISDVCKVGITKKGSSSIPSVDILDVTWAAVLREMGEEMGQWDENWKSHHSDCRMILAGVVNDDSTPVDRCHFGFIYRLDMAKIDIPMKFARESGISAGWRPVDKLAASSGVESWSHHVARFLHEATPVRSSG